MAPRLNIPLRLGFWSYLVLRRHSRPQQLARTWVIDSRGQRLGAVSSIHRFRDRRIPSESGGGSEGFGRGRLQCRRMPHSGPISRLRFNGTM